MRSSLLALTPLAFAPWQAPPSRVDVLLRRLTPPASPPRRFLGRRPPSGTLAAMAWRRSWTPVPLDLEGAPDLLEVGEPVSLRGGVSSGCSALPARAPLKRRAPAAA